MDKPNISIHFFYVTLILVLTIIGLVTHRWTGIVDFREYLNVGATVTSLVLGILAIIYAFVSSGQQSGVLGAVEAAASSTSAAVAKLDGFMNSAERIQAEAAKRADDLHSVTKNLATSVSEIKDETMALASANRELSGKVSVLPDQLGQLRDAIERSAKGNPGTPALGATDAQWTTASIESAVKLTSPYGLATVEAIIRAHELKKDVSFTNLSTSLNDATQYVWGFAIGFNSTLLVSLVPRAGEGTVHEVRKVHPELIPVVEAEWKRRELRATKVEDKATVVGYRAAALRALVDPLPATTPTPNPHPPT